MPSPANLFASILFGAIGMGAFLFGKKSFRWQPMVLGVALMGYPYFVSRTWLLYVIGSALCLGLFILRE
ncbi:MAG: hypothetical protein ACYDBW_05345 [Sulfuricaulis sp.]